MIITVIIITNLGLSLKDSKSALVLIRKLDFLNKRICAYSDRTNNRKPAVFKVCVLRKKFSAEKKLSGFFFLKRAFRPLLKPEFERSNFQFVCVCSRRLIFEFRKSKFDVLIERLGLSGERFFWRKSFLFCLFVYETFSR